MVRSFDSGWREFVPFPHLRKALLALLLAMIATHGSNRWLKEDGEKLRVLRDEGNRLELLLHRAFKESKPILMTVSNRKIYVVSLLGFSPTLDRKYVAVLPYRSGYRDSSTLAPTFLTDYVPIYADLRKNPESADKFDDFELVLPIDDIVSATIYAYEISSSVTSVQREASLEPQAETTKPIEHQPEAASQEET
jgi:hypothetical protein